MSAKKDETTLTERDIYEEHQREVRPTVHWVYLFSVLGGGLLLMLGLIAILGGTG